MYILAVMYCAIDVGGTKTLVALFDERGNVKTSLKFPTPRNYSDFSSELEKAVVDFHNHDIRWTVVAAPGRINRKHGVVQAFGNLDWVNVSMQADVENILRTPVSLENDAKLAALSEAIIVKDEYKKVLYLTVSTGIGGGLVINGKLDPHFLDMEVGQMLLEYRGELMQWEDFGSGRAFNKKFGQQVGETKEDDHKAWYWLSRNLAIGMIDLMATLTPDVIIIGGGAGSHLGKFHDRLTEQLKIYENPMFKIPPIIGAKRPEEAVIYGCYELAKQRRK